jgi:hypothetical protein
VLQAGLVGTGSSSLGASMHGGALMELWDSNSFRLQSGPDSFKQAGASAAAVAASNSCAGREGSSSAALIGDAAGVVGQGSSSSSSNDDVAAPVTSSRPGSTTGIIEHGDVAGQELCSPRAQPALPGVQPQLQHASSRLAIARGADEEQSSGPAHASWPGLQED